METVKFGVGYRDMNRDATRTIEQALQAAFNLKHLQCTYAPVGNENGLPTSVEIRIGLAVEDGTHRVRDLAVRTFAIETDTSVAEIVTFVQAILQNDVSGAPDASPEHPAGT